MRYYSIGVIVVLIVPIVVGVVHYELRIGLGGSIVDRGRLRGRRGTLRHRMWCHRT